MPEDWPRATRSDVSRSMPGTCYKNMETQLGKLLTCTGRTISKTIQPRYIIVAEINLPGHHRGSRPQLAALPSHQCLLAG